MSNYCFVVSHESAITRIRGWLSHHDVTAAEIIEAQLDKVTSLFIIGAGAAALTDLASGVFFRGYAVDYSSQQIVFGLPGYSTASDRTRNAINDGIEGEYLIAHFGARAVSFYRDLFAMAPLLHTSGPGFVALSDSILTLSDLRAFTGLARTQNDQVLLARAVSNTVSGQQLSHETYMKEIAFLRIGETIEVTLESQPTIRSHLRDLTRQFTDDGLDYRDVLVTSARRMAGLMRAASRNSDWPATLRLSGGYDSRACLAAATAAGVTERIRLVAHNYLQVHAVDFQVASDVAAHLGVRLNPVGDLVDAPPARSLECSPLTLWAVSNLGVYDFYSLESIPRSAPQMLEVSGLGAELSKGSFGWQSWPALCRGFELDPRVRDALEVQGRRALSDLGVDPEDDDASEWHNLAYRNALHASRHLPAHLAGLAPLQQRDLVAMGRSSGADIPRPASDAPSIINDLAIVLDPELALLAYDREEKRLSRSYIEARLQRLGGPLRIADEDELEMLGDVGSIPSGPSDFSIRVAENAGMSGDLEPVGIIELSRLGLETIADPDVNEVYSSVLNNAIWRLSVRGLPPVGSGSSPAKLPAILALFR